MQKAQDYTKYTLKNKHKKLPAAAYVPWRNTRHKARNTSVLLQYILKVLLIN